MLLHWTFVFCDTHALQFCFVFCSFFYEGESTEDLKSVTYIKIESSFFFLEESGHSLSTNNNRDYVIIYIYNKERETHL